MLIEEFFTKEKYLDRTQYFLMVNCRFVLMELLETEKDYVDDLSKIVEVSELLEYCLSRARLTV